LIQSKFERTKGKRRRARPRAQGATQGGKEGEAGADCAWLLIQNNKTKGKEGHNEQKGKRKNENNDKIRSIY